MWRRKLFCLCTAFCVVSGENEERESRVVNIAQGPVRGYKDQESGVYFFYSIPYATVPSGPHRYKAPLPPRTWTEPFEAVNSGVVCPQPPHTEIPLFNTIMKEDCLTATVYVPDVKGKNLPVVVYVHGGAYQKGFGDLLQPVKVVAEHHIIYVTFNYRLGTLGFLCLGTEDVPGNAGMKDQVALLRWVKNNIANFGGNPNDITIAGYSAGSTSVELLMLSKSAEGLFNKVIAESGGSLAPWVIQTDPLGNAKRIANAFNFTKVDDIYALEEFYRTAPFELLTSVIFDNNTDSTFGPSPCLERDTSEDVFLNKSPVDILKSGSYKKVPLLYGFTNMEGLLRLDLFQSWRLKMDKQFSDFLPPDLKFESRIEKEKVAKEIKEFYFDKKRVRSDKILDYIDFFTDVTFAYPMLRALKYYVETGHDQLYLYEFSYVDEMNPFVPYTNIRGANHCAQSLAVMGVVPGLDPEDFTEEFLDMSSITGKMWSTFIKTGQPVDDDDPELPSWPAVNGGRGPYMSLNTEITLRDGPLLKRRAEFWDGIYEKYYREPIPPPKPTQPLRSEL